MPDPPNPRGTHAEREWRAWVEQRLAALEAWKVEHQDKHVAQFGDGHGWPEAAAPAQQAATIDPRLWEPPCSTCGWFDGFDCLNYQIMCLPVEGHPGWKPKQQAAQPALHCRPTDRAHSALKQEAQPAPQPPRGDRVVITTDNTFAPVPEKPWPMGCTGRIKLECKVLKIEKPPEPLPAELHSCFNCMKKPCAMVREWGELERGDYCAYWISQETP